MPDTAERLNLLTESVIREMTRIANKHDAINLSQGFPDINPPEEVLEAAHRAISGSYHQYAITWGATNFRQALAKKQSHFMNLTLNADDHIVVTCGGTEAMMVAMMTACNPGDKVIVFSPFYENYGADTVLTGAQPIYVPLHPPDFSFDPDELRAAFQQGVKALVLCNPANPSGKVFTRGELTVIADLEKEFDTFIITDEVYEHIVYKPHEHVYMAALPDMFERTLSLSSLSKTYSMTGWRLGYVIAPKRIILAARKVHDFLTVGAAAPLQEAAVTGLNLPLSYYEALQKDYTHKRDLFCGYLDEAKLTYVKPQGAYYVMVDISEFKAVGDTAFCHYLAKEVGVAAVPGSSFFHEPVHHFIRFHFAKNDEILIEAGRRLIRMVKNG